MESRDTSTPHPNEAPAERKARRLRWKAQLQAAVRDCIEENVIACCEANGITPEQFLGMTDDQRLGLVSPSDALHNQVMMDVVYQSYDTPADVTSVADTTRSGVDRAVRADEISIDSQRSKTGDGSDIDHGSSQGASDDDVLRTDCEASEGAAIEPLHDTRVYEPPHLPNLEDVMSELATAFPEREYPQIHHYAKRLFGSRDDSPEFFAERQLFVEMLNNPALRGNLKLLAAANAGQLPPAPLTKPEKQQNMPQRAITGWSRSVLRSRPARVAERVVSYAIATPLASFIMEKASNGLGLSASQLSGDFMASALPIVGSVAPYALGIPIEYFVDRFGTKRANENFSRVMHDSATKNGEHELDLIESMQNKLLADRWKPDKELVDTVDEKQLLLALNKAGIATPADLPRCATVQQYAQNIFVLFANACSGKDYPKLTKAEKKIISRYNILENPAVGKQKAIAAIGTRVQAQLPEILGEFKDESFDASTDSKEFNATCQKYRITPEERASIIEWNYKINNRERLRGQLLEASIAYAKLVKHYHMNRPEALLAGANFGSAFMASSLSGSPLPLGIAAAVYGVRKLYIRARKPKLLQFDAAGQLTIPLDPEAMRRETGSLYDPDAFIHVNAESDLSEVEKDWYKRIGTPPDKIWRTRYRTANALGEAWSPMIMTKLGKGSAIPKKVSPEELKDAEDEWKDAKEKLTKLETELDKKNSELEASRKNLSRTKREIIDMEATINDDSQSHRLKNEYSLRLPGLRARVAELDEDIVQLKEIILSLEGGQRTGEEDSATVEKGRIAEQRKIVAEKKAQYDAMRKTPVDTKPMGAEAVAESLEIRRAFAARCHVIFEDMKKRKTASLWSNLKVGEMAVEATKAAVSVVGGITAGALAGVAASQIIVPVTAYFTGYAALAAVVSHPVATAILGGLGGVGGGKLGLMLYSRLSKTKA